MKIFLLILIAIESYLLGGINGAIIISRFVYGRDIRQYGSGSAGLTNMLRTFGMLPAGMVLLIDVLKSLVAVLIGAWLFGFVQFPGVGRLFAGFCLMMGHVFPVYYGFQGGKGVLCGAIMALLFDWRVGLICIGAFAVIVFFTRYVSLGSILGAAAFPIVTLIFPSHIKTETILALCCALLLIYMHRSNISRLISGKESKLSVGKVSKTEDSTPPS